MALSQMRDNFCLEFVKSGNASDAYRKSYSCENQKEATVNNNAYKLMQHSEIITRIKELRDKAESIAIMTIEQRKEMLSRFAWEEESDKAMKAIDLLNKMDSVYIQRQDVTTSGSVSLFIPPPNKDK